MTELKRYVPKSQHKGRPDGLQPIINRLPYSIEPIIMWHMQNVAVPITPFARKFFKTKRRRPMLQKMILVLSACLEWCQIKAGGLIAVPHGSKRDGTTNYMPLTKNQRCDTEEDSKDYMYGIAALSGVGKRWTYDILGFFRGLGMMGHDGWENHFNNDHHSIRISKYCFSMDTRSRFFSLSEVPFLWRDRYEKKNAKVIARAKTEPTPPRPPLFKATGVPESISKKISNRIQLIKEGLKAARERTKEELLAELEAFSRPIMPQGP